jgi:hypothetical protein
MSRTVFCSVIPRGLRPRSGLCRSRQLFVLYRLGDLPNLTDNAKQVREPRQGLTPFEPFIIEPNYKPLFAVNIRQDMKILKTWLCRIHPSEKRDEPTFVTWWVGKPTESALGHSNWPRKDDRNHRASCYSQSRTPFPSIPDDGNVARK